MPVFTYTRATVSRTVPRFLTCEKCGCGYTYDAGGTASHTVGSSAFGGQREQLATDIASIKALSELRQTVLPCPDCGWFQSSTLPDVRRAHRGGLRKSGIWLLRAAFVPAALGVLFEMRSGRGRRDDGINWMWLLVPAALMAAAGVALLLIHRQLARNFDPNAEYPKRLPAPPGSPVAVRTDEYQQSVDAARAAARDGRHWYFTTSAGQHGPVSPAAVRDHLRRRQIAPTDRVWSEGMEQWLAASAVFGEA